MDESLRSYTRIRLTALERPEDKPTTELLIELGRSRKKELNIFRVLSVNYDLLVRFSDLGAQLSSGTLSSRLREAAILRTAALCNSAYEWEQHLARARASGLEGDEIVAIANSSPFEWGEREAAVLGATSELVGEGELSDGTWAQLQLHFNDQELVELVVLVSFYISVARIVGGLAIPLEKSVYQT